MDQQEWMKKNKTNQHIDKNDAYGINEQDSENDSDDGMNNNNNSIKNPKQNGIVEFDPIR